MSKTAYTAHDAFHRKLNVPSTQAISLPKGYRHHLQKIASQQTPSWGSWFSIRISEKNVTIDNLFIEFTVSSLTGLTVTSSGTAGYLPAHFWAQRIDIYLGSQLIESIPATAGFLINQLLVPQSEEKRLLTNTAAGLYSSHTARATKSAGTDVWYLPVSSFWRQASFPLMDGMPDLEIRIQMANLSDSFSLTSGSTASGTPASTFTGCNAVCQFSRLPASVSNYTRALMSKSPLHYGYQDIQTGTYTVSSGVTTTNIVLSSITGFVSSLFFVLRTTSPANANLITYSTALSSFEILSAGSENIVGGQPILESQNRLIMCGSWLPVTFTNESAGVYMYSWSYDPKETFDTNAQLSGHHFTGSEVLKLNFSSSLGSAISVDVYAMTYSAIEVGNGAIRKIALSE
jgi:hypothetical protein